MDNTICWVLQVAIHPGKLDDFRAVARDLIASAQKEPNTLAYEWNVSADETICDIYESYKDSDAILIHVQGFGQFAERFMQACHPVSFHVYGAPSDAVKAHLADLQPVYFKSLGGFSR